MLTLRAQKKILFMRSGATIDYLDKLNNPSNQWIGQIFFLALKFRLDQVATEVVGCHILIEIPAAGNRAYGTYRVYVNAPNMSPSS
jgi:hypothetical protein